jgi:ferredoxin
MPNVTFVNWNKTIRAGALANVRTIAKLAGISLYNGPAKLLNCRGAGTCGTCRVKIEPAEGVTPPTMREKIRGYPATDRLACQAVVASDRVDIRVTKMDGLSGKGDVAKDVSA